MTWTLADIRTKVRQVSGRLSLNELSNTQLDAIINQYMTYEFPAEVKLDRLYTFYTFNTSANTPSYNLPSGFTNFVPEAYIDNRELLYYTDYDKFVSENTTNVSRTTIATGDGTTTAFSTTLSTPLPIQAGSVIVDDSVETFTDNGSGGLVGDAGGSGTIDYQTGALAVTFNSAPADEQTIQASWIAQTQGMPTAVLQFNNQFTFYPTPDRTYRFRIKAYTISSVIDTSGNVSSSFSSPTDRPLLDQWGPAIAYGAARRLHADYSEMQAYQEVTALYKEQLGYVLRRTHQDLLNSRALPMF